MSASVKEFLPQLDKRFTLMKKVFFSNLASILILILATVSVVQASAPGTASIIVLSVIGLVWFILSIFGFVNMVMFTLLVKSGIDKNLAISELKDLKNYFSLYWICFILSFLIGITGIGVLIGFVLIWKTCNQILRENPNN